MTREEAISILKRKSTIPNDDYCWDEIEGAFDMAIKALEREPSDNATLRDIFCIGCEYKEQEPKTGHWITKIKSDLRSDMWPTNPKCSECGGEPYYSNTIYSYKFCPYCGANMRGE